MATVTSIASGDWTTDAATVWDTGSKPVAGDDVVIAAGHAITLSENSAATSVTIADTGSLAIGGNTLTLSGAISNSGSVTGGPGGKLDIGANSGNGLVGEWILIGASGNLFELTSASANPYFRNFLLSDFTKKVQLQYVYAHGMLEVGVCSSRQDSFYKDCVFTDLDYGLRPAMPAYMRVERCTLDGPGMTRTFFDQKGCIWDILDTVVGGTSAPTYGFYGTLFSTFRTLNLENNATGNLISATVVGVYESGYQGAEGDWRHLSLGGAVLRSTDSKKAGVYGIEMIPSADCAEESYIRFDISIPVVSGQSVAPSFYYKNVDADLDLEAAADRFVAVLDPGDEWGLHEEVDVNGASDSYTNWRQVAFTGGTVGGTGAKGLLVIRIYLKRYVSGASVYVADPADA